MKFARLLMLWVMVAQGTIWSQPALAAPRARGFRPLARFRERRESPQPPVSKPNARVTQTLQSAEDGQISAFSGGWGGSGGSSGGLETPDGTTAITETVGEWPVKAYGASGKIDVLRFTVASGVVTTVDVNGDPTPHGLVADNGLVLLQTGDLSTVTPPQVTVAGITNTSATASGTTSYTFTANATSNVVTASGSPPVATGDPVRVSSSTTLPAGLAAATTYYWGIADIISSVDTGADTITFTTGQTALINGSALRFEVQTTMPGGVTATTEYFGRKTNNQVWTLYDTQAHAIAGGATGLIDITAGLAGTLYAMGPGVKGAANGQLFTSAVNATTNASRIDITDAGTGTHTVVGYTQYEYTFRSQDGYLGWSAASTAVTCTNWAMGPRVVSNNLIEVDLPPNAHAIAAYGRGTSGRDLQRIFEARSMRDGLTDANIEPFDSVSDSGGFLKLNVPTTNFHSIGVGDIVNFRFLTTGDEAFFGQAEVTAVSGSVNEDLTTDFAWDAGMTGGSGVLMLGSLTFRDYGTQTPLNATKFVPDEEARDLAWRYGVVAPLGSQVVDTAGNRLFYAYDVTGSKLTDFDGTPTEPTWTAVPNVELQDNEVRWKRQADHTPLEDTSGATRKAVWTKVATVPSASTLTVDHAIADVASPILGLIPNDAEAIRDCQEAIDAYDHGGTIKLMDKHNVVLPPPGDSRFWTNTWTTAEPKYAWLVLGHDSSRDTTINIQGEPGTHVWVRQSSATYCPWSIPAGDSAYNQCSLLALAANLSNIQDVHFIRDRFASGFNEHDTSQSTDATNMAFFFDSSTVGTTPQVTSFTRVSVDFPYIGSAFGAEYDVNGLGYTKQVWDGCHLTFGGGDGNQGIFSAGDFTFTRGSMNVDCRLSSQAFYFNIGKGNYALDNVWFRGIAKNSVQIRGSGGDDITYDARLSNIFGENSGSLLLGDSTTSNRNWNLNVNQVNGLSVIASEVRGLSVSNVLNAPSFSIGEDVSGATLSNINARIIDLSPSDQFTDFTATGLVCGDFFLGAARNGNVTGLTMTNPCTTFTSYRSPVYEWLPTGTNSEYYCVLRATQGNPSISSPTAVKVRGNVTTAAGTLGSLGLDTWYYGDPLNLGFSTIVVQSGDSNNPDPDSLPLGAIETCVADGAINLEGSLRDVTLEVVNLYRTDGAANTLIWGNFITEAFRFHMNKVNVYAEGQTLTTTYIPVDFGSTELPYPAFTLEDWFIRQPQTLGSSAVHKPLRLYADESSIIELRNFKAPYNGGTGGSGLDFGGSGRISLHNVELGTNQTLMELSVSGNTAIFPVQVTGTAQAGGTNTITLASGASAVNDIFCGRDIRITSSNGVVQTGRIIDYVGSTKVATVAHNWMQTPSSTTTYIMLSANDLVEADSTPVYLSCLNTISGGITNGNLYWVDNGSPFAIYPTKADADANTNAIDITGSDSIVIATLPNLPSANVLASNTLFVSNDVSEVVFAENVRLRGGTNWRYADITTTTNNINLQPVTTHIFTSSNSANLVTGFANGWPGREMTVVNGDATESFVLDHANSTDSLWQNQINCHTGADITVQAGESVRFIYIDAGVGWRTIGF